VLSLMPLDWSLKTVDAFRVMSVYKRRQERCREESAPEAVAPQASEGHRVLVLLAYGLAQDIYLYPAGVLGQVPRSPGLALVQVQGVEQPHREGAR
jgi:hypothetical protein